MKQKVYEKNQTERFEKVPEFELRERHQKNEARTLAETEETSDDPIENQKKKTHEHHEEELENDKFE